MSGRPTAIARARIMEQCLLEAGAPEVSIEVMIGRPSGGDDWNACRPIGPTSHHIASYPTVERPTPGLALVKAGRVTDNPPLYGPLANGTAGVDLVYRIICMGYANHPGFGGPITLSGPMGAFTIPKDNGRPYLWGTEYEGGFDDETWDRVYTNRRTGISMTFREFMGRCNNGIARGCWLINEMGMEPPVGADLSGYHIEHSSWAPGRKSDRRGYTTASGRAEMTRYEENPVTPQDVWEYGIKPLVEGAKAVPARIMLAQTHKRAGLARSNAWAASKNAETAVALGKANAKALRALAVSLEPTVRQAVEDALGEGGNARLVSPDDAPVGDD